MKKIKRIIALALATVMMMAMSITAFAAEANEANNTASLTINISGISTRENSEINVYQLATIDKVNNKIVVENWAKNVYKEGIEKDNTTWVKLIDAIESKPAPVKTVETNKADSITIDGLAGGIYYVTMSGTKVVYNSMVAKAYTVDANGAYVAADATVVAKGSSNTVDKEAKDKFVYAGEVVHFTITSTVPYDVTEYTLTDRAKNLTAPANVTVKVGGSDVEASFDAGTADGKYTKYVMDLTSLVVADGAKIDTNAGKTVVVEYDATVVGDNGYVNQAYDSTFDFGDDNENTPPEVNGYTGDIVLTKVDSDKQAIKGDESYAATFTIAHKFADAAEDATASDLEFVMVEAGVYKLAEANDQNKVTEVSTNPATGTLKVTGLDEGKYVFTETKAPKGYAKRADSVTVTVDPNETKNVSIPCEFLNTKLSSLPFTGGMGTTIFTVLGVAIMAIAAALYFATKKSSHK
ncbi:MAG: isopeptide-forming domain-containing fimbrial protein [Pseudobutyrivibrio sp.]|nr:isopeptide-forming domain-containing fimbrial protein [Pseudobutyrivibrio sp.]